MAGPSRNPESQNETYLIRIQSNGWRVNRKTYSWSPPTDVFENEKDLIIKIEIAGMKKSEIFINIEDHVLIVTGSRKESIERRAFRQMEIRFGDFNSTIELPDGLSLEEAVADYDDGFLTITVPHKKSTTIQLKR